MISYHLNDYSHQNATNLVGQIQVIGPAPGLTDYTLHYQLRGPFVDLPTQQDITGFPSEEEAFLHGARLFHQQTRVVVNSPLWSPGRNPQTCVAWQRGDIEVEGRMWWGGDDGWEWEVEYWWPGEHLDVLNQLKRIDPVAAYLEMRRRFLEVVLLMGGSAMEIETRLTPFPGDGSTPPGLTLPTPYQEVQTLSQAKLDSLRAEVQAQHAKYQAAHPDGPPVEEDEEEVTIVSNQSDPIYRVHGTLRIQPKSD